ncbi:MAG: AAA family ATPase, partial [Halanaerobiales bacterium]
MALQGVSGSGKTYSALLLGYGLCENWSKIAVIDTENHSAHLYAGLGGYQVAGMDAPFEPEKYIEAIQVCENAGMEVIIMDSLSHEWEGAGGILDTHGNMAGNSFTNWAKLTPRHNAFIQAMLQSSCHIIATIRTKQDYVLTEKNGKQVPEKVGLKAVQREGMDYEFTVVLDLDIKHYATASKDRSSLFMGKPPFIISSSTGEMIRNWCNSGVVDTAMEVQQRIQDCRSLEELFALYKIVPEDQQQNLLSLFTHKRQELSSTGNNSNTSPAKIANLSNL